MSGEPTVILPGEAVVRLVGAAAKVAAAPLGRYAIIGGVAVSVRLPQTHRATADIDTVVDDMTPPPAIETLLALPAPIPIPPALTECWSTASRSRSKAPNPSMTPTSTD